MQIYSRNFQDTDVANTHTQRNAVFVHSEHKIARNEQYTIQIATGTGAPLAKLLFKIPTGRRPAKAQLSDLSFYVCEFFQNTYKINAKRDVRLQ